ncbi:MAG TPA: ion channel [Bacteroidia bacterium]|jgi:inward rectifier potassium channel|nr:ion channel [Bacteroidia bacterium]
MKSVNKTNDDLGFGTKGADRSMKKDGSFNLERVGEPKFKSYEIYHNLITMSWKKFIFIVLVGYLIANSFFAVIYFLIGMDHFTQVPKEMDNLHKFTEAFFFSSQTLTTLGYGRVAPVGALASAVAAIESMIGLLSFALATGLLYGKFSRPQAKLLWSENAIIAPYKGMTGLMFRMANMRKNQLIEVEIEVTLAWFEKGNPNRQFSRLTLERNKVNIFPTSWTLVHPIDETSPFVGATLDDILAMKAELIILLKAFDDTFSQTVYARTSYRAEEFLYGKKFLPMFSIMESGRTRLDLRLINAMENIELPKQLMVNS